MPQIDIELPGDLASALQLPSCADLGLPKAGDVSIQLPSGALLRGVADITAAIPTDCSLSFSLLLQLGPLLASTECLVRLLKLVEVMLEAVKSPPPTPQLVLDIVEAADKAKDCFVSITPVGMIPFVRDVLRLVAKILNCLIETLETVAGVMLGLAGQIDAATKAGNTELAATLGCAQENAVTSAAHAMTAFEPVVALMTLLETFMELANVAPIELPAVGTPGDAESLNGIVASLKTAVQTIEQIADAL